MTRSGAAGPVPTVEITSDRPGTAPGSAHADGLVPHGLPMALAGATVQAVESVGGSAGGVYLRSGTPGLPDLTPGTELPRCLRTVVGGRTVFLAG